MKRRDEYERKLRNIRADMAAAAGVLDEARQEDRAATVALVNERVAERQAAVRSAYADFAASVIQLRDAFLEVKDAVEDLDRYRHSVDAGAAFPTDEGRADWRRRTANLVVEPLPRSLPAMFDAFLGAMEDEFNQRGTTRNFDDWGELLRLSPEIPVTPLIATVGYVEPWHIGRLKP